MKSVSPQSAALLLSAVAASGVHAVQDLPGGPAVRQLNLHDAATRIASEISWLHWFMLITCTIIFLAVFSVMF
jgi:cytochrome c oxidase subunit 2